MVWSSSDRREELPRNWAIIRQRVMRRDGGLCRGVLDSDPPRICGAPGTEVDHVLPGLDHSMGNLQTLCSWCHKHKTQAESRAARDAINKPYLRTHLGRASREPTPDPW